jgi:hypothetical protein
LNFGCIKKIASPQKGKQPTVNSYVHVSTMKVHAVRRFPLRRFRVGAGIIVGEGGRRRQRAMALSGCLWAGTGGEKGRQRACPGDSGWQRCNACTAVFPGHRRWEGRALAAVGLLRRFRGRTSTRPLPLRERLRSGGRPAVAFSGRRRCAATAASLGRERCDGRAAVLTRRRRAGWGRESLSGSDGRAEAWSGRWRGGRAAVGVLRRCLGVVLRCSGLDRRLTRKRGIGSGVAHAGSAWCGKGVVGGVHRC